MHPQHIDHNTQQMTTPSIIQWQNGIQQRRVSRKLNFP